MKTDQRFTALRVLLSGIVSTMGGKAEAADRMNVSKGTVYSRCDNPAELTVREIWALGRYIPEELKENLRHILVP